MDPCPLRLGLTDLSDLDFGLGWTSHPTLPLDVQGGAEHTEGRGGGVWLEEPSEGTL